MLKEIFDFVLGVVTDWTLDRVIILFLGAGIGILGVLKLGTWMNWFASPWRIKSLEREKTALERELKSASEDLKEEVGRNKGYLEMIDSTRAHHKLDIATWEDRVGVLTKTKDELGAEVEKWHDQFDKLAVVRDENKTLIALLRSEGRKLLAQRNKLHQQLKSSEQQNLDILNQDGKFWERPPEDKVPPFRPRAEGSASAAIIAVMNLKGGVGKTTITANLGYTLARQGKRVLMIDADHQGTLSSLCLNEIQLRDALLGEGRLVNNLFKCNGALDDIAFRNLTAVNGLPTCSVLAASNSLVQIEEMSKARWLIKDHPRDVRYLFREAFHTPLFQDRFDVILIDCPPRPTSACINALAAADYLLVPTLLDKPSVDAIPNLLGWIKLLKGNQVCPDLEFLGIIGNRSTTKTLSKKELQRWKSLSENASTSWGGPPHQFKIIIPQRSQFAAAADTRTFAAADAGLQAIFQALTKELLTLKVLHEHRSSASVPA